MSARAALFGALGAVALGASALAQPQQPPNYAPLPAPAPTAPLLPADSWWNVDVSSAPLDTADNATFLSYIGPTTTLHPDFGGNDTSDPTGYGIFGFPYVVVAGSQPLRQVVWDVPDETDPGMPGGPAGYPIPDAAITQPHWIEGGYPGNQDQGNDQHLLLIDRDHRLLYEMGRTRWNPNPAPGHWEGYSGAVFSLDGDNPRPDGWTSADAAGLAIFPGLVRYDEVRPDLNTVGGAPPIRHAFRVTISDTQNAHVFPASHTACNACPATAPPMGARLRLKATKDISGFPPYIQRIFQAMKTYGLIVADNGSSMYISGTYDPRWNNDELNPAFAALQAADFEFVQLGWKPAVGGATGGLGFYTVTPCRLFDSRLAGGPFGGPALYPGFGAYYANAGGIGNWQRVVPVTGQCGIPADAKAVSLNVTVAGPAAGGFLRLLPGNFVPPTPTSSTINFAAGKTRANNAVVMLPSSGSGTLSIESFAPVAVQVVIDLNGYFK